MVLCVCGKDFSTEANLRTHLRRNRCRGPPNDNMNTCRYCGLRWETFGGLRQHQRQAHPAEYNRELENRYEVADHPDAFAEGWSEEDLLRMVRLEAGFTGRYINQFLLGHFPGRTVDQIKYRRRGPRYAELVAAARRDGAAQPVEIEAAVANMPEVQAVNDRIHGLDDVLPQAEADDIVERNNDRASVEPIHSYISEYMTSCNFNWEPVELDLAATLVPGAGVHQRRHAKRLANTILQDLITLRRRQANEAPRQVGRSGRRVRPPTNRSQRRGMEFRKAQSLWKRDRARLSQHIIDDKPFIDGESLPEVGVIKTVYKRVFERTSPPDNVPIVDKRDEVTVIASAITPADLEWALSSSKSTATGPDGLSIVDLRRVPVPRLVLFFNALLLHGIVPPGLDACRTTLLYKGGETRSPDSWRPITISSIVIRVFHKILARRLADVNINVRQKGFTKCDGVLTNGLMLQTLLKDRRSRIKPYCVCTLDLKKAFDSVSRSSILRSLVRLNVDDTFKAYVENSFAGSFTKVRVGDRETGSIRLKSGVRQGDPLSPYLFNFVLDELVCKLELLGKGLPVTEDLRVSVLAYADDLVLLAETPKEMQRLIDTCVDFLGKRGMAINELKSHALCCKVNRGNKHSYIVTRPLFNVRGKAIPTIQPLELFAYLGRRYDVMGMTKLSMNELKVQLDRIGKSPLRPSQKLCLVKTYLIPRYLDRLQTPQISSKILREADRLIRVAVRRFLHLNRTCSDAYLHAPVREGGLGVLSLRCYVPSILRRRISNIRSTADEATSAVIALPYSARLWDRILNMTRTHGGVVRAFNREWSDRLQTSYSGNGLRQGACNGESGSWIDRPPPFFSGSDYIKCIQLRGNLLPTRGLPSNPPHERRCRAGCERVESLTHVLQKCPIGYRERIRRHDFLVSRLRGIAEKKGWSVDTEPRIRCADGTLRIPDLILVKDSKVVVTDVAVSWEGSDSLQAANNNKVALYSEPRVLAAIANRYRDGTQTVLAPMIVGARGIWAPSNATIENEVGLSRGEIRDIITSTLIGGLGIYNHHMKGG